MGRVTPVTIAAALACLAPAAALADDDRMTRVRTSAVVEVLDDPHQVEDIISRLKSQAQAQPPPERAREGTRPATIAPGQGATGSATAAGAASSAAERQRELRLERPALLPLPARDSALVRPATLDKRFDPRLKDLGRDATRRERRR